MHSFGRPPTDRRAARAKLAWIGIWLVFMAAPVKDLADGGRSAAATVLGSLGLAAFIACYLTLVFRYTTKVLVWRWVYVTYGVLVALATALSTGMDAAWLGLWVYVAVSAGAVLPMRQALWVIPSVTALMLSIGVYAQGGGVADMVTGLGVTTFLVGFAMTGVRHLIRTTVELRQARATVAQLAANEERLRLARDLHDLLGHSLSLITLKSELAGRMLPAHPDRAAQQVADIEQVSRQALVDVREAVTGYRRLTLPGQLAGARTALTAAGIEADVPLEVPEGGQAGESGPGASDERRLAAEEREAALAWALREAVTNVVRHSSARRCAVTLTRRETLAGPVLELVVEDDGVGLAPGSDHGNGLTGLTERLEAVGGALDVMSGTGIGRGARRQGADRPGFRLVARVPAGPDPAEHAAPTALGSSA
ncbi:sensor histidine kinase [Streptomyces aurantiacus]|uniref:Putative Sensor histidine kinase YvfT n=1 Tax=Streptomyces aurantiacus JA 4570 TaxID=1286094 RepID=S3ZF54_9ACTN|nr:sensor histidine kinase [Streptomyces aurantiacus]EPH41274.1 putative Sensor histidine kinase YvfT [Streptomyces aurantiacus JA 4570]